MQPAASPAALARESPDETSGCPARSRPHGGKRQQAATVQGLRRENRQNAHFFLAESLKTIINTNFFPPPSGQDWTGVARRKTPQRLFQEPAQKENS